MKYINANFNTEENAVYFTRDDMVKFAKEYHKEQLKLTDVSQQRELLLAYEKYCDKMNKMYENQRPKVLLIDAFLSQ